MPQQMVSAIESTFTRGLITEATGLNFPINAATDCSNVEFTIIGDVLRREGIDFETNYTVNDLSSRYLSAVSTYIWTNAGGDGSTKILVVQNGANLYFFNVTASTTTVPLSVQKFSSSVIISDYLVAGGTFDQTLECQYSDGNGFLFVYNANCDPFYVSYNPNDATFLSNAITLHVRDFQGVTDSAGPSTRPLALTAEHNYNLQNQGWTAGNPWYSLSTSGANIDTGSATFTVSSGLSGVTNGQNVAVYLTEPYPPAGFDGGIVMNGTVTSYVGSTLVLNIYSVTNNPNLVGGYFTSWALQPFNTGYINTWFTDEGNYPSNSDVWWYFKNSSGAYDPTAMEPNITLSSGNAPQGHYILNPFNQDRSLLSGISGLTPTVTNKRPTTGCWFQGRVWYAGTQAFQTATGDANTYSWSEDIYFSQVNVGNQNNFGNCYQINDPTSENLFDILATDGGVIQIQGSGLVKKLFTIQNGMLVFAQNGVWFITGSSGIGFAANDYTITKISSVEILSATSFVDVLGLPYFWNLEGIYKVEPTGNGGGLAVTPITVDTIKTFYNNIPNISKKYARGAYNPIDYTIQWIYKTTPEISVTDRYAFDGILNLNTYTKAFFPYLVPNTDTCINSITFVQTLESTSSPAPAFKYLSSNFTGKYNFAFADEHDTAYVDWGSVNYTSYFITGYNSPNMFSPSTMDRSKGIGKFQAPYVFTYSRTLNQPTAFYLQSVWDFGIAQDSNRWSSKQLISTYEPDYGMVIRRSRLRGMGLVMQIKISSVDGQPFDIMGWTLSENVNARP